jgi:hypothetical protein
MVANKPRKGAQNVPERSQQKLAVTANAIWGELLVSCIVSAEPSQTGLETKSLKFWSNKQNHQHHEQSTQNGPIFRAHHQQP